VEIEHVSPVIAQQWVGWLVNDINRAVRDQDIAEATRSIEYLKAQVANTALAELQSVFFELIQGQTEKVMLAQARPEYVFKTIDPPVVPEEKSKPQRALICMLGVVLGGIIGTFLVLARHYLVIPKEQP
jgi:LPS O-antigen subunit length determinant protein (WzzB/FepE family)